jgi:hypothetical protein
MTLMDWLDRLANQFSASESFIPFAEFYSQGNRLHQIWFLSARSNAGALHFQSQPVNLMPASIPELVNVRFCARESGFYAQ